MRRIGLLVALVVGVAVVGAWPASAQAGDLDCEDFTYQEDAQAVYNQDTSDPHRLDADNDGVACETLPHRPAGVGPPAQQLVNTGSSSAPRVRIDGREYAAQCGPNTLTVAGQGTQGAALTVNHTFTIDCAAAASAGGLPRTGLMVLRWGALGAALIAVGWMLWAGDRFLPRRRLAHGRRR